MNIEGIIIHQLECDGYLSSGLELGSADTTFDELGLDSLDKIELVQAVEDRVMVDLPKEKYPSIKTIRDLAAALEEEVQNG